MADIHALCFERGWPELDMSVHLQKDICIGTGDPLASFIICRQSADQAEILTIATHADKRSKGMGALVLNAAIEALQSCGAATLFLEVAEDNMAAQALYRKAGFVQIGRRPSYYRRKGGRVAALTLSKNI